MKSVVSKDLASKCLKQGSLVLLHRFSNYNDLIDVYEDLERPYVALGVSVGVKPEDYGIVTSWVEEVGARIVCIDVAHCDHKLAHDMVRHIRKYNDVLLIAGNVCTYEATRDLFNRGVDVVKVGIGNGAACTTRMMTGCGVPAFTALMDCYQAKLDFEFANPGRRVSIIADGGIKAPKDACIALTRADLVMMGWEFAQCQEAHNHGFYQGSSTYKSHYVEGITKKYYVERTVDEVYNRYHDGIRSCCSYLGSHNLAGIKEAQYTIVSQSEQLRDRK
jgi:IMP dehydrogenase